MKWIAIAAALILCAGGFAGWSLLRPSQPAVKAAPAETAKPATPPPTAEPNAAQPASGTPDTAAAPAAAPAATPAPSEPAPNGFAQIVAAIPVRVAERGESLGASTGPLSMAPGRHVLELSNDEVGYRSTVVVDVRSGRTTRVSVALPRGSVNINATPWAEVFVDGQRLGETPLGNLQLTVGAHEVRFRHPQLGEQVRTVVITTGAPGRLSVDMKK